MKPEHKPKEQFKEHLREWSEDHFGVKFDNLNNTQRSRQMINFFVQEVLEKLVPGIVPDDEGELESCIVDGPGDGGADLVYRTDEGQVLIIQAKYRGKDGTVESAESVGRVCDILERLYLASKGKQKSLHKDLLELSGQIDWEEDTFRVYFITTGKSGESVKDRVKQGLVQITDLPDLGDRSEFRYLDNSLLNQELREAISSADFSNRPIVIPMITDTDGRPWCHFEGGRELYVGEVSGAILANILQTHKASLFTMNIRDYVGDSKTNKQIIKTALGDPTNFEYFNNGVTAVAGKITPDIGAKTLTCERMSIINGAQTVRSLLAAVRRPGEGIAKPVSSVRVMLRLMSFEYPAEVPFVGEVTKYNNTQNAVKIADFRSNDEVQKDISRRFNAITLNGRKYEYKNKRSSKKRNSIAVSLEELTKAVFAFKYGPDDIWGGTSKLFDASAAGLYTRIFPDPDGPLAEFDFNLIAGTFFLCDYIRTLWEDNRRLLRSKQSIMHPALERKGLIYFAVGELERQNYEKQSWNLDQDLSKMAKPNQWLLDTNGATCLALAKAFEITSKVLSQRYDEAKKANAASFKHRNWFREQDTLRTIKEGIELALAFGTVPRIWH